MGIDQKHSFLMFLTLRARLRRLRPKQSPGLFCEPQGVQVNRIVIDTEKPPCGGFSVSMVKAGVKTSNRIQAEDVLDEMMEWSYSLNNLQRDQLSIAAMLC